MGVQSRMLCVLGPLHFCAIIGGVAVLCFAVSFLWSHSQTSLIFFLSVPYRNIFLLHLLSDLFFFSEK